MYKKNKSQTKPTNAKKRNDAYAAKYKNVNTAMKTKTKYVAPIVKNLANTDNVKDYQCRIIAPQAYALGYGHQGNFVQYAPCPVLAHAVPGDKAQCLTVTVPGTDNTKRNGNRIIAKSINLYCNIRASRYDNEAGAFAWGRQASSADPPANVNVLPIMRQSRLARVIIFIDQTSSLRVPQIEELLDSGTFSAGTPSLNNPNVVYSTTSQLRPDATTRFKVVRNEVISLPENGVMLYHAYIPLEGLAITYKSDVDDPSNVNTNGVFMFVLNDIASNILNLPNPGDWRNDMITFDFTSKFRFIP